MIANQPQTDREEKFAIRKNLCGKSAIENAMSNNEMTLHMQACESAGKTELPYRRLVGGADLESRLRADPAPLLRE